MGMRRRDRNENVLLTTLLIGPRWWTRAKEREEVGGDVVVTEKKLCRRVSVWWSV